MSQNNPAASFNWAARAQLKAMGEPCASVHVAERLGVLPQQWARWVRGDVSPRAAAVSEWVEVWPLSTIELVVGRDGWRAR